VNVKAAINLNISPPDSTPYDSPSSTKLTNRQRCVERLMVEGRVGYIGFSDSAPDSESTPSTQHPCTIPIIGDQDVWIACLKLLINLTHNCPASTPCLLDAGLLHILHSDLQCLHECQVDFTRGKQGGAETTTTQDGESPEGKGEDGIREVDNM
jgi:hypothetical protein